MTGAIEFIVACFTGVNLPYTILLLANLAYWGLVILGAVDIDSLDFDFDADADFDMDVGVDADLGVDMDADADIDADAAAGAGGHSGALYSFLRFFNVTEMPVMIVVSFFTLSLWVIAMTVHYILGVESGLFMLALLAPNIFASLAVTKVVTAPFKSMFRKMVDSEGAAHEKLVGKICAVISSSVDDKFGQVEVTTSGSPIILNARTRGGEDPIEKGSEAVLTGQDKDKGIYFVTKL